MRPGPQPTSRTGPAAAPGADSSAARVGVPAQRVERRAVPSSARSRVDAATCSAATAAVRSASRERARRRRRGRRSCRCRASLRPGEVRPRACSGSPGRGGVWRRSSGCRRRRPGVGAGASRWPTSRRRRTGRARHRARVEARRARRSSAAAVTCGVSMPTMSAAAAGVVEGVGEPLVEAVAALGDDARSRRQPGAGRAVEHDDLAHGAPAAARPAIAPACRRSAASASAAACSGVHGGQRRVLTRPAMRRLGHDERA